MHAQVLVNVLAAVGNAQLFFGLVVGLVAATGALLDLLRRREVRADVGEGVGDLGRLAGALLREH